MNFSIIYPTRERWDLLKKALDSVRDKTLDIENVEVLLAIDDDDTTDYEFLKQYSFVRPYIVKRSLNFSKDYYTFLAFKSTGRWIITSNDDGEFCTKNWDKIAFEALHDKPNVIYGYIDDGLTGFKARGGGRYCCFPLQGRAGVEAMGFVFPSRIPIWGADLWTRNTYDAINSCVDIPMKIMHYCHHNRTRTQDGVSMRIAQNQSPYSIRPQQAEIEALFKALHGRPWDGVIPEPPVPQAHADQIRRLRGNFPPRPKSVMPAVPLPKPWTTKKIWISS